MTAKFLSLEGKTRPDEIKTGFIEALEEWLAEARDGELKSLMMIGINQDNTFRVSVPGNDCTLALIGAMEFAKRDLIESHDD